MAASLLEQRSDGGGDGNLPLISDVVRFPLVYESSEFPIIVFLKTKEICGGGGGGLSSRQRLFTRGFEFSTKVRTFEAAFVALALEQAKSALNSGVICCEKFS